MENNVEKNAINKEHIKCPNCNMNISVFDEICPNCKVNLDEFEKNAKEDIRTEDSKTTFLKIINVLQLIGFFICTTISWANNNIFEGFIFIAIGLIVYAFIKGFSDIIDLLCSINDKL